MEGEKYNPYNEEYEKVSDLPQIMKKTTQAGTMNGTYRDVSENLGGGFVRESAYRDFYQEIQNVINSKINRQNIFDNEVLTINSDEIRQDAINRLESHAYFENPINAIIQSEMLLLKDRLYGIALDKMSESLPNKSDWVERKCIRGCNLYFGQIGSNSFFFRVVDGRVDYLNDVRESYEVDSKPVSKEIASKILDLVKPVAVDYGAIDDYIYNEYKPQLEKDIEEKYKNRPDMLKSKNKIEKESKLEEGLGGDTKSSEKTVDKKDEEENKKDGEKKALEILNALKKEE